jgi:hypothetical protein
VPQLKNRFFDIILELFSNKELMKEDEELTENIKSSFMYGLKSENSKIRSNFHDALSDSIGKVFIFFY